MSSPINGIGWQDASPTQDSQKTSEHKKSTSDDDSVKLSVGARVHQLRGEGFSTQEIAADLGLTTSEVQTYLGISSTSSATSNTTATTSSSKNTY